MLVKVPGGEKDWTAILPPPLRDNPDVLVMLVPDESVWRVRELADGTTLGVVELPGGTEVGVQVIHPPYGDWAFQYRTFQQLGLKLVSASYVGPLSSLPNRVLMTEGMCPLVFLHNKMNRPFFNVKRHFLGERLERLNGKEEVWS